MKINEQQQFAEALNLLLSDPMPVDRMRLSDRLAGGVGHLAVVPPEHLKRIIEKLKEDLAVIKEPNPPGAPPALNAIMDSMVPRATARIEKYIATFTAWLMVRDQFVAVFKKLTGRDLDDIEEFKA